MLTSRGVKPSSHSVFSHTFGLSNSFSSVTHVLAASEPLDEKSNNISKLRHYFGESIEVFRHYFGKSISIGVPLTYRFVFT